MNGVVNLYKPKGWTSRDAVNKVRSCLGVKEVGHMGTLDPQGEGVLPVGVGKATRLFDAFLKKDKVYEADFAFGYETDTLDGEGTVVSDGGIIPSESEVEEAIGKLVGEQMQIPPAYSAKSVGGVRAYDLARKGEKVELKPALVTIYDARVISRNGDTYRVYVHCGAGTYIRSVCRDLAYSLGTYATMISIKRIRSGVFKVENSVTVDDLINLKEKAVIPVSDVLADFPRFDVPDEKYEKLRNGVKIFVPQTPAPPFAVYCRNELFGLGELRDDGTIKIKTYLKDD